METTINFRIDEDRKEHLQNLADQQGEKVSTIVRQIIYDHLDFLIDEERNDFDEYTPFVTKHIVLPLPEGLKNNY
jgi:predicted transcriptional regulator